MSMSEIEKGEKEGGMRSLGVVGQVNCSGWVEWREGDVGRGLQVVFAKLKGQQLEPIC